MTTNILIKDLHALANKHNGTITIAHTYGKVVRHTLHIPQSDHILVLTSKNNNPL